MEFDNDEIIEEIPIFLSKNLSDHLYILQYPNKKLNNNLDNAEVIKCCVKPMNEIVKIDYGLDTASEYYDRYKGEKFAKSADGLQNQQRKQQQSFPSGQMDRQNFLSTQPMDNVQKYIVCVLQDKEIHATAIKNILQMRPNFSYFDKDDKRKKDEQKAENEADVEEEQAVQVTVKFARTENDRIRKAREKSYTFIKQKNDDEPWCETLYHGRQSRTAESERKKLFSSSDHPSSYNLNLTNDKYMESLIPMERSHKNIEALLPSTVISMNRLKLMSLIDQIEVILKDAKVVTFNKLLQFIKDQSSTTEKILRTLPQIGLMINGNWVLKSELLYKENSVSGTNGVCSELMCRARDYVLYQLSKSEYVNRKRITETTLIPPEEVKEILESIAYYVKNCGWTLILPPNRAFEEQYPEIKQRQDMFWNAKEEQFNDMEMEKYPKRIRKKSIRESSSTTLASTPATTTTTATSTTTQSSVVK